MVSLIFPRIRWEWFAIEEKQIWRRRSRLASRGLSSYLSRWDAHGCTSVWPAVWNTLHFLSTNRVYRSEEGLDTDTIKKVPHAETNKHFQAFWQALPLYLLKSRIWYPYLLWRLIHTSAYPGEEGGWGLEDAGDVVVQGSAFPSAPVGSKRVASKPPRGRSIKIGGGSEVFRNTQSRCHVLAGIKMLNSKDSCDEHLYPMSISTQ